MNYADLFRITLPETALEVAALLVLIIDLAFLRRAALNVRASVAALLGIAGCIAALWLMPGGGMFSIDGTANTALLVTGGLVSVAQIGILVLTGLTLVFLVDAAFTRHVGEYVAIVLMSATGGLLIAGAQDLLIIFIGLELLSLGLYVITAFAKQSGRSAEAAMKYYLFGGMSAAFLLFGFSYLYGLTGSTNLHQVVLGSITSYGSGSPLFYVALVLVAAGLGFKVAAVPFHLWAPDAYEGAPAPAAAFIASVSKVASFALLIGIGMAILRPFGNVHMVRMVVVQDGSVLKHFDGLSYQWSLLLAILAAASMVVGNLAALAQISVRRLLAYSAIAHAGYMLTALAYLSSRGASAILYYILTYGVTTIAAFGVIGVIESATGTDRLDGFLGLSKRNPLLAAVLLVLFLSLAGIPPLVGFWAKFNLFAAVLSVDAGVIPFVLVALAVAFSAVSLYYYLQVLKRAYVMPAVDEAPIRVHPVTMIVLLLIAAAVVVLGCLPSLLQNWIAKF
ncbi:NADH-quinone oxidoreductase subunit N [Occallatibacter riparius]|uniref:NADH-quinone oxidoreductase subunit N n=1 Tax=Occallatibacter riparius TaxID=1002689 RepID=A0A9J7BKN6_9BACT|nr:NADH-quinone oxidoreductase subunit N [Occallatibacter riparius]UWZ83392.1 NADH-quinone oxidoreductase subunit N [Occallatibacter riparius]